jgi:hypothetical protein
MTQRNSTLEVDMGFGRYALELEEQTKAKVQILTTEPALEPKDRIYYCSKCNGKIHWIEESKKYICYNCSVTYSEIDTPLSSIDQSIRPLQSVDPYERIEPAIVSRRIDTRLEGQRPNEHVQVSGTLRRATIRTDNLSLVTEDLIRKELEYERY